MTLVLRLRDTGDRVRGLLLWRREDGSIDVPDRQFVDLPGWLRDVHVVVAEGTDRIRLYRRPLVGALELFGDTAWKDGDPATWREVLDRALSTDKPNLIAMLHTLYRSRADSVEHGPLLSAVHHETDINVADTEVPVAPVAALSGLLFDAKLAGEPAGTAGLEVEYSRPSPLRDTGVRVETGPNGYTFRLLDAAGRPVTLEIGQTLRAQRWDGPGAGTVAYLRHATGPDDREGHWWFRDEFEGTTMRDGLQLRWTFTLFDVHGEPVRATSWRTTWERGDRPPPPQRGDALYDFDSGTLSATVKLPALPGENRARLEVRIYGRTVPIVPCGYYGGADDTALIEVQRALDFHYASSLAPSEDASSRVLAGGVGFAHHGLALLGTAPLVEDDEVHLDCSSSIGMLAPAAGLELHAVLARKRLHDPAAAPVSVTVRCDLRVRCQGIEYPVVQLERVPPRQVTRVWCTEGRYAGVDPSTVPTCVTFGWKHEPVQLGAGAPIATGGYRLWVRDFVADADPESFRHVADVQVMPPLLASFRPLPPLAGDWTGQLSGRPAPAPTLSTAAALEAVERAFGPRAPPMAAWLQNSPRADDVGRLRSLPRADGIDFVRIMLTAGFGVLLKASVETVDRLVAAEAPVSRTVTAQLGSDGGDGVFATVELRDAFDHPYGWCILLVRPDAATLTTLSDDGTIAAAIASAWSSHRVLREPRAPIQTLVLDAAQSVRFPWTGLTDRWAHRLEWAVEALDRYALLRDGLPTPVGPAPSPGFSPATVYVPRTEDLAASDRFAVLAEPVRHGAWFSFRVLEPAAWQGQTHNTAVRTRLGHLSMDLATRRTFPYGQAVRPWLEGWGASDFEAGWMGQLSAHDGDRPEGPHNVWGPVRVPLYPVENGDPEPLPPEVQRVEILDEPWYFRVALLVRLGADDLVDRPSVAEQDALPQWVGLPRLPQVTVGLEVDDLGARYVITITIMTAVLGGHLSDAAAARLGGWSVGRAADDVPKATDYDVDAGDLPVHLLPDLALDYSFRLVTSGGRVDLVRCVGPLAASPPPGGTVDTLGYRSAALPGWASVATVGSKAAVTADVVVTCPARPDLPPAVAAILEQMTTDRLPHGMDVCVRRDGRLAPPLLLRTTGRKP